MSSLSSLFWFCMFSQDTQLYRGLSRIKSRSCIYQTVCGKYHYHLNTCTNRKCLPLDIQRATAVSQFRSFVRALSIVTEREKRREKEIIHMNALFFAPETKTCEEIHIHLKKWSPAVIFPRIIRIVSLEGKRHRALSSTRHVIIIIRQRKGTQCQWEKKGSNFRTSLFRES